MEENKLNKWKYVIEHLVWMLLTWIVCIKLFFRCIPGCTYLQTWIILAVLSAVISAVGIAFTINSGRNSYNIAINLIMVWGVFVLIAYRDLFAKKMFLTVGIMLGLSLLVSGYIMFKRNLKKRRPVIKKKIQECICCFRCNLAIAMVLIMLPIGVKMTLTGTVLQADPEVAFSTYGQKYSMSSNLDKLVNLEDERFGTLGIDSRLELAKTICYVEARYLGINTEINIGATEMSEEMYYNPNTHQVFFSLKFLEETSPQDLVDRCLHIMYHVYQHSLMESYYEVSEDSRNLMFYRDMQSYLDIARSNDSDGWWDSFFACDSYTYVMETEANEYAQDETEEYFRKVESYIKYQLNE